jgi:hypothetical protein
MFCSVFCAVGSPTKKEIGNMKIRERMEPQPRIILQGDKECVTILNDGAGRWISPYGRKGDVLTIVDAYPENENGDWYWIIELQAAKSVPLSR